MKYSKNVTVLIYEGRSVKRRLKRTLSMSHKKSADGDAFIIRFDKPVTVRSGERMTYPVTIWME